MKLEQTFEVTASANEIEARTAAFMQRNGYQQSPASKTTFTRGSRIGSYISFSPRRWQARATVLKNPIDQARYRLTLAFDINDEGQVVTQHERLYWKAELDHFQNAVQTGDTAAELLAQQHRTIVKTSLKGFLIFLVVGLLVAVPISVGITLFNPKYSQWGVTAGAICGVVVGLFTTRRRWGL